KQAARAGVDLIAHSVLDRAVDDELVALMREHGTAYGPTLAVYEPVRIGDAAPADPGAPVLQRRRANFAVALANVKRLHEAGVPVVVATDAGMPGTPHGRATTRELELLVRAGLSPAEAPRAATATAARVLGMDDRGRIAPRMRARLGPVGGEPGRGLAARRRARRARRPRRCAGPPPARRGSWAWTTAAGSRVACAPTWCWSRASPGATWPRCNACGGCSWPASRSPAPTRAAGPTTPASTCRRWR